MEMFIWEYIRPIIGLLGLVVYFFIKCIPCLALICILNKVFGKTVANKIIWILIIFSIFS